MQPLKSFNSNLGTAILITGGAGVGKTVLAMRLWPKSYVFVADLNFKSGKDYLEKICKSSNIVGFDTATPDEDGKPVPPALRYPRMMNKISAAIESKDVDVIILDSATFIEDIIKARICNATSDANVRLEGFKQWGDLVITWKSIILQLRQSGKKLIMIAHENKERDESDGIYKYQIAVDGSIREKFPVLFSDVWRCEVNEEGLTHKHTWNVRMLGNVRQEHLKRSSEFSTLPAVLTQDALVATISPEPPTVVPVQQPQQPTIEKTN
jgi:hypothetical protein